MDKSMGWMDAALAESVQETLDTRWVLDCDTTVKLRYILAATPPLPEREVCQIDDMTAFLWGRNEAGKSQLHNLLLKREINPYKSCGLVNHQANVSVMMKKFSFLFMSLPGPAGNEQGGPKPANAAGT